MCTYVLVGEDACARGCVLARYVSFIWSPFITHLSLFPLAIATYLYVPQFSLPSFSQMSAYLHLLTLSFLQIVVVTYLFNKMRSV